jgi:hypothetical protein
MESNLMVVGENSNNKQVAYLVLKARQIFIFIAK